MWVWISLSWLWLGDGWARITWVRRWMGLYGSGVFKRVGRDIVSRRVGVYWLCRCRCRRGRGGISRCGCAVLVGGISGVRWAGSVRVGGRGCAGGVGRGSVVGRVGGGVGRGGGVRRLLVGRGRIRVGEGRRRGRGPVFLVIRCIWIRASRLGSIWCCNRCLARDRLADRVWP